MKFWELTGKNSGLSFNLKYDTKDDTRSFNDDDIINWGAKTEIEYNEAVKQLSKAIEKNEYIIYFSYDVSGFDYWMLKQEEQNYAYICVHFKDENFNGSIKELDADLLEMYHYLQNFETDYSYNPSEVI